jgi:hypothetical protein
MDVTVLKDDDQHQLIRMSSLSTEKTFDENLISKINTNNTENELSTQTQQQQQQILILRLFSWLRKFFRSFHLPHLSDRILRLIFLLFITLIGITSFTIALLIGSSMLRFKQQCPLYASFQYKIFQTIHSNWTVRILPLSEKFSSQSTCDFCTFYNVFTFIYCIMTEFFFILFNGDHRVITTNDQCLIIPW